MSPKQTIDAHPTTEIDPQLKQTFETITTKIQQIVAEHPNLFVDVGEETIDRFDHLVSLLTQQTNLGISQEMSNGE